MNQVSYPPSFPVEGRFPTQDQVKENLHYQRAGGGSDHDNQCIKAEQRVPLPCTKMLHISLFFDGTGNNLYNDIYRSDPRKPTNIARLFRASIGAGYAGGTAHIGSGVQGLIDPEGTANDEYFKYYIPGVGTPFPEVDDFDYSTMGMAAGAYGEERVNWALMMLIDALRRVLKQPRLDNFTQFKAMRDMCSPPLLEGSAGRLRRFGVFSSQLKAIEEALRRSTQPSPLGLPKLLAIKLYVYGFSRGAAAARAFVKWLDEVLHATPSQKQDGGEYDLLSLTFGEVRIPITVEYLGLLDTVASVGIADIMPGADGHMSWADENQELPRSPLVRSCLHIVASHEQRLCFPLESIRRESGEYPESCTEVIYPGVHSDQGGGYAPGYQGKAIGGNDGLVLSQIALHDLYADAFAHGAPLKVPKESLPKELHAESWRVMEFEVLRSFLVHPTLVARFNAWREVTLGLLPTISTVPQKYRVQNSGATLEEALHEQLAWITAWRIDRYGFESLKNTVFYSQASDDDEMTRRQKKNQRDEAQKDIEGRRSKGLLRVHFQRIPKRIPEEPGLPEFDPDIAKTQLREAAEEFGISYRDLNSDPYMVFLRQVGSVATLNILTLLIYRNAVITQAERQRVKEAGQEKVSKLFPPPAYERNHMDEKTRGNVAEWRNALHPEGLLRDLFDDHIHDSRSWFLYADLNKIYEIPLPHLYWNLPGLKLYLKFPLALGREPWGSYFNERVVFFGEADRRSLAQRAQAEVALNANADSAGVSGSEPAQLVQAHSSTLDGERLAKAQQGIDTHWQAYQAKTGEVNNASA
ncbi:hypothetical protein BFW88_08885 [Pseudomonas fluorescens]|nr:hypothetical protein BFW88_08885 [Pseudomonas fluorescens]OPB13163.1 hypothetical protein BFW92_08860 [Pseudomonas fluorescens]OPB24268.1 hypothetical protein BFW93_08895 [Pseudomonas fluorescens]